MKEHQVIKSIQELTTILRESEDALVKGVRSCLKKKGLEPNNIIVAEWFPDDVDFEYGIVVDSKNQVFQFGYDYHDKNASEGEFSEWLDITNNWKEIPLCQSVEIALKNYEKIT